MQSKYAVAFFKKIERERMNAMEQPAVYPKSDLENSERNGVFSNGVSTIVQVDN